MRYGKMAAIAGLTVMVGAAMIGVGGGAAAAPHEADQKPAQGGAHGAGSAPSGHGMMGQGMTHGMMGQGMMGQGMMRHQDGAAAQGAYLRDDLSVEDARHSMGHLVDYLDNERLRLGKIEEIDKDSLRAEIETVDGSLVQRYRIDRHTGAMTREFGKK